MSLISFFKRLINPSISPVALISGKNAPSVILVDLVSTKILRNLDNIDFKSSQESVSFAWKGDDIVVAGARTYKTNYDNGLTYRTGHSEWSIKPQIKINSVKHDLSYKEENRLWNLMVKTGKMKLAADREAAEIARQKIAVESIAVLCERESDDVAEAKRLSQQAILQLQEYPKSKKEVMDEWFTV
jgi:hypothetical protein